MLVARPSSRGIIGTNRNRGLGSPFWKKTQWKGDGCDITARVTVNDNFQTIRTSIVDVFRGTLGPEAVSVAIKRLRFSESNEDRVAQRRRDIESTIFLLQRANHANVAQVFGIYVMNRDYCIVSAWGARGTLAQYLQRNPDLSQASRLVLLIHGARGLDYLHSKCKPSIVHGNLHAANIIVTGSNEAKICDFGLKRILPERQVIIAEDQEAISLGKFAYIAPELHQPGVVISKKSDVFAFGVLIWTVLSGSPPFIERGPFLALKAISEGERPTRDETQAPIGDDVWKIISSCWSHRSSKRPKMGSVRARLARATKPPRKLPWTKRTQSSPLLVGCSAGLQSTDRMPSTSRGGDPMESHDSTAVDLKKRHADNPDELTRRDISFFFLSLWCLRTKHANCAPNNVTCVAYMPDGDRIVSGWDDGAVRIEDIMTRQIVGLPMTGHTGTVLDIAVSLDGVKIASGSNDRTIRIWSVETGATVAILQGHDNTVSSVAFSPDGRRVVSGSTDADIRVWDVASSRTVVGPIQGHLRSVYSVSYSPDGSRLVSGTQDFAVSVWNAETGENLWHATMSSDVSSAVYSPDGKRIVVGCYDGSVRIVDAETGENVLSPLTAHTGRVYSVAFSPDGKKVASGSGDHTIRLWNAETGEQLGILGDHRNSIRTVAFSPNGKRVAFASADESVHIWDTTGELIIP